MEYRVPATRAVESRVPATRARPGGELSLVSPERQAAVAAARAEGATGAAEVLARGRLEVIEGGEPARVEGRAVVGLRVALWVSAADRVLLRDRGDVLAAVRRAVASAVEAPDAILRELLVLQERGAAVEAGAAAGGYRDAPPPRGAAPSGAVVAATAAALARADGDAELAAALARAVVALEPMGDASVSHVTVALDPADLARVRRDPRVRAAAAEAVETAARTATHRAADVAFVVRVVAPAPVATACPAEDELAAAARRAGWGVVPVARDAEGTTLALVRDGAVVLVRIGGDGEAGRPGAPTEEKVARLEVPAEDLRDETGALRVLERLEALARSKPKE